MEIKANEKEGMRLVPELKSERTNLLLRPSLKKAFIEEAKLHGTSLNDFANSVLKDYVDNNVKKEVKKEPEVIASENTTKVKLENYISKMGYSINDLSLVSGISSSVIYDCLNGQKPLRRNEYRINHFIDTNPDKIAIHKVSKIRSVDDCYELAERLFKYRAINNFTQEYIANGIGVSVFCISSFENHKTGTTAKSYKKIRNYLDEKGAEK